MTAVAAPPERRTFWRMADPVMEGERVLKGGMWEHQRRWWDLPNKVRLLVTGYGGGKSLTLCKRMISLALANAPAPCAMISPTFPVARTTIVAQTIELMDGRQRLDPSFRYVHHKVEHAFTIRHKGRVGRLLYYSGEDPARLKGPNLGAVGIDEPFIQDVEVFKQAVARVRHPAAVSREVNLTGTPEGLGWGYELAEGEMRDKYDVGIVQASTRANKALRADYEEDLNKQYGSRERAAYVEGLFVNLSAGQVYYGFDPARNVVDLERPEFAELGAGMDFGAARNYASMAAVALWHHGDQIHVTDEFEQQNSDTPSMCVTLREQFGDQLNEVYPDPAGNSRQSASGITDFRVLSRYGFTVNAPASHPARRDRFNRVNEMLEAGRLTISPRCKKIRQYLSTYTHEEMHKGPQKQMSHLLDALGYACIYLFPAEDRGVYQVDM